MKRIIIICEGETEQEFCAKTLYPHFLSKDCIIQHPLIKKSMGGIVKWSDLHRQIEMHLKNEADAYVTTFIDYYGLYAKHSFPQWEEVHKIIDKNQRMGALEKAMHDSVHDSFRQKYIPYVQLHEFEGLLFNDINIFYNQIPAADLVNKNELERTFRDYSNPEMINENKHTSPSHRLGRIIKGYNKIVYGNVLAEAIGLQNIRAKSPRFNAWIGKLEKL